MGYIANFIVYTLAMVGVIVFALFIFKNATTKGRKTSKYIQVLDSISLGQRKMLYIVSVGKEKFLVSGDVDRTSLISKLEFENLDLINERDIIQDKKYESVKTFEDTIKDLSSKSYMDKSIINRKINSKFNLGTSSINNSVMRNFEERIKR